MSETIRALNVPTMITTTTTTPNNRAIPVICSQPSPNMLAFVEPTRMIAKAEPPTARQSTGIKREKQNHVTLPQMKGQNIKPASQDSNRSAGSNQNGTLQKVSS